MQDYRLGVRMLLKYPGLTLAGGLALALAIGLGAGYYDFMGDFLRPRIPLPEGHAIVEVEMRNTAGGGDERRIVMTLPAGSGTHDRSRTSAPTARSSGT